MGLVDEAGGQTEEACWQAGGTAGKVEAAGVVRGRDGWQAKEGTCGWAGKGSRRANKVDGSEGTGIQAQAGG